MTRSQFRKKLDDNWSKQVIGGSYGCEVCGVSMSPDSLSPHHYIKRSNFNLRWEIRNGTRVCQNCHTRAERKPIWFAKWLQRNRPADKEFCDRNAREPIRPWKTYQIKEIYENL